MANHEQTTEQTVKTQIAAKVDPSIFEAVEKIARDDERTVSNTIERLLRSHPQIEPLLEAAGV